MLVQDRRARRHCLIRCVYSRQFFIFDLKETGRLLCGSETRRRHCRNRLAAVADAFLGQRGFVLDEQSHIPGFEVRAGNDGLHTWHRKRLRYVVR